MSYDWNSNPHFEVGNQGLLRFLGENFLISVRDVDEERLLVSFPANEYPLPKMCVNLEFQDETGHAVYELEVLAASTMSAQGLLLKLPPDSSVRGHHRSWWRLPADFRVEIKDHVHPRRVEVPVIDISGAGMLVHSENAYDPGDNVDLFFRLSEDNHPHAVLGQVVHFLRVDLGREHAQHIGIKFVATESETAQALSQYAWRRVRELPPPAAV